MAIVLLFSIGCKEIKVQNYYLPTDFTGNVAVIYSKEGIFNPQRKEYNYFVPACGVLCTGDAFKAGYFKINYYQRNNLNGYDTLFEEVPGVKLDTSKNRVFFTRVLTFRGEGDFDILVNTFYVGKARSSALEKNIFLFERKLEKMTVEIKQTRKCDCTTLKEN